MVNVTCVASVISLVCQNDDTDRAPFSWHIDAESGAIDGKRPQGQPLRITPSEITWTEIIPQSDTGRNATLKYRIDRFTGRYFTDVDFFSKDGTPDSDFQTGLCKAASRAF
jgi:hypothetical protein